mgnify:CR=1 FL=1
MIADLRIALTMLAGGILGTYLILYWRLMREWSLKVSRLLVFLLIPDNVTQQHLEILSEIAELLSDGTMRENMLRSASQQELHGLITAWSAARVN